MCSNLQKVLLVMLIIVTVNVRADGTDLLVGLHIQAVRMDLQYATSVRRTDLNSLDLLWGEQLNSWLDGSVKLGIIDLTQTSNPVPAGQATSGNSLGLGLRFQLYQGEFLKLHADMNYQYADTTADVSGQKVEIRWHQISGQLQADIRLVQYTYLFLAAGTMAIDGDEQATGTITSVQSFRSNTPTFERLGILIGVDPTSQIGIEVNAGSIAGGRIYFQRWF